jgi:POT family proton-dependent oligopeptide transporter
MAPPALRWPRQIRYIVGNEACERFSFYGMRSILVLFLAGTLLGETPAAQREPHAKEILHLFMMGVYFFPLLGGYLADRRWGKYRTILWLSLVYCAGHACLALFDDQPTGFYLGLFLITLGSGGIKPCVAAFVGDQFTAGDKALLPRVFAAFYWSINLGSLGASLLIPWLLRNHGPKVAFGLPGVLMLLATVIFWLGRRQYRELPPVGHDPHSFGRVLLTAWRAPATPGTPFLDRALATHPREAVEGVRAVLRILKIFAFIPFFWMLFDQKASAWVLQAKRMELDVGLFVFHPAQLQFINPALVMLLVPLTTKVLYPMLDRTRFPLTPLRRMTAGMFLAALSFVVMAWLERALNQGAHLSVLWHIVPYLALTVAEIFVSVTGLEFAYAQAPLSMKGTIMSFWYLAVAGGNLVVAVVTRLNVFHGAESFLFYAAIVSLAGVGLGLVARRHVSSEFFRAG